MMKAPQMYCFDIGNPRLAVSQVFSLCMNGRCEKQAKRYETLEEVVVNSVENAARDAWYFPCRSRCMIFVDRRHFFSHFSKETLEYGKEKANSAKKLGVLLGRFVKTKMTKRLYDGLVQDLYDQNNSCFKKALPYNFLQRKKAQQQLNSVIFKANMSKGDRSRRQLVFGFLIEHMDKIRIECMSGMDRLKSSVVDNRKNGKLIPSASVGKKRKIGGVGGSSGVGGSLGVGVGSSSGGSSTRLLSSKFIIDVGNMISKLKKTQRTSSTLYMNEGVSFTRIPGWLQDTYEIDLQTGPSSWLTKNRPANWKKIDDHMRGLIQSDMESIWLPSTEKSSSQSSSDEDSSSDDGIFSKWDMFSDVGGVRSTMKESDVESD